MLTYTKILDGKLAIGNSMNLLLYLFLIKVPAQNNTLFLLIYRLFKKSCPNYIVYLLYENDQDFLDMQ